MGDIGSIVTLGLLAFVAYCVLFGLIWGLKRGTGKATFRLITIVVALIGSIIATSIIAGSFMSTFEGVTVEEAIRGFWPDYDTSLDEQTRSILANFDGETAQYVLALPLYLVLVPVVFVVLFYVLKLITLIIFWILSAVFGFLKKKKTGLSRLGGMAIGIVQGLLIAIITLVPVCGILGIANEVKPALTAENVSEEIKTNVNTAYSDIIDPIASSPVMAVASNVGGNLIYKVLTNVTLGGAGYNVYDETVKLGTLAGDILAFGEDFDWTDPEPWREPINDLVSDIGDNGYVSSVVSGVFRVAAGAIDDGLIELPEDEPYKSVANDLLTLLETSDKDNLKGDLTTIASVYNVLGKYDVLVAIEGGDSEEITNSLTTKTDEDKTVISLVIEELKKNERTKPLTASMAKISVALMCNNMGIDEDATELYEDVKGSVNNVLAMDKNDFADEQEYVDAVANELDTALQSHDIVLEEEVIDGMAEYINENFSDLDEITDEEINDVILSYYDAYADYLASGNPDDLPDDIPNFGGGDGEGEGE